MKRDGIRVQQAGADHVGVYPAQPSPGIASGQEGRQHLGVGLGRARRIGLLSGLREEGSHGRRIGFVGAAVIENARGGEPSS